MLRLLLDEHLGPGIRDVALDFCPELSIELLVEIDSGTWRGFGDEEILRRAYKAGLTLLSYDQRTLPGLLTRFGIVGEPHGGVILVNQRTIPSSDYVALAKSMAAYWRKHKDLDWTNRSAYLPRTS